MQIDQLNNFQDSETESQIYLKLIHIYMIEGTFHVRRERVINNLISAYNTQKIKLVANITPY